ncbi:AAA family ATPase [Hoyosella rhizosphaerae]|uniref:Nuclease SbcCD subunit C n=1 Tax=Hoyosella rhizosphaerae TaxID=1755582 RepID=A0A916TZW9_9ACTN|nr:AAA family ATPase [Hoyosella rhizosphaerae]MBN4927155.1 AAA family ATPase [Hoyosella rhizosphaerae]GGC53571.1 ABC transporter ATP-binding protein [Hoyosella rhizosphaerae]
MKLHSIVLHNFRQFKGSQRLDLQSDTLKPVTLLFGANGAGKTTFLNAFTWALYGTLSEDVEQQGRLVTDSVWRATPTGGLVEVSVELNFDHEGQNYRIQRRASIRKEGDHQATANPEVQVWVTKLDGSSEVVDAPQEKVFSILPKSISRFFFFNGERIEKLVEKSAYAEVQQDIKVLLDLEQVERALVHLPKVDKKLSANITKFGGSKASAIQAAIDKFREEEASLREEHKLLQGDLAILNEERENVRQLLLQHEAAAPIQQQRDEVTKQLAQARTDLATARKEHANLIATRGFLAFTAELGAETSRIAEKLYRRGALPAPLKREFVDQLLDEGECICGTPLDAQSAHWNRVNDWRQRAGLQAVETVWQKLSGQIEPIAAARTDLRDSLSQTMKRIGDLQETVARLEATKSELDGKLSDNRLEGVQALESKRIDLDDRYDAKQRRVGSVVDNLKLVTKAVEQKVKERSNAEVTDILAAKARARSEMVESVCRALKEILEIRSERMRQRLDAELKSVYKSITYKNYIPAVSESFQLTLHTFVDGVELPVGKSTGENQILSLSFVAAVSKLARELRRERHTDDDAAADAGTYPIVMDAAFGSLDENYQEAVSRALARMAPQLVVLVSKSQGLGKVANELTPYVSHLGIIEAHSSLPGAGSEDIQLRGHTYPYIRHSDSDYALLKEVT